LAGQKNNYWQGKKNNYWQGKKNNYWQGKKATAKVIFLVVYF
jgi:hypothetical protein